jgi:hypothetical protein
MAITFVQEGNNRTLGSITSVPISATGSGNLIVVMFGSLISTVTTVTDNAGNTYYLASGGSGVNFQGGAVQIWYAYNSLSGATSVTVSINSSHLVVSVQEFSGVLSTSDPLDIAVFNSEDSNGCHVPPHNGPILTPSTTSELLVSFVESFNVEIYDTVLSPWLGTSFVGIPAPACADAYYINPPVSTQQAHWLSVGGCSGFSSTGAIFLSASDCSGTAGSAYSISENGTQIGTNSNSTLADNLNRFSVSSWFKTSINVSNYDTLIWKTANINSIASPGWGLALINSFGNVLALTIRAGGSDYIVKTPSSVVDGLWHNIVATYDSVLGSKLYLDGIDVTTVVYGSPGGNLSNAAPLAFSNAQGFPWNGSVDDTRIWDVILSSVDASIIASGGSPSACPIAYWRMEEGSGNILNDSTGNGNTITFNIAPTWSSDIPSPLSIVLTLSLSDSVTQSDSVTPSFSISQDVSDSMTVTDSITAQSDHIATVNIPTVESLVNQLVPAEVKTFFRVQE